MPEIDELLQQKTLTVAEAAKVLGSSTTGIYDGVHRGEIPAIRMGRRILIPTGRLVRELLGEEPPEAQPEPAPPTPQSITIEAQPGQTIELVVRIVVQS